MSYFQRDITDWVTLGSMAVPEDIKKQFRTIGDRSPTSYDSVPYHLVNPKFPGAVIDGQRVGICYVCNVPYPMWTQHCPGIKITWDSFHAQNIRKWLKDCMIDFKDGTWWLDNVWIKQVNVLQDTVNNPPGPESLAVTQMKAAAVMSPEQVKRLADEVSRYQGKTVSGYVASPTIPRRMRRG